MITRSILLIDDDEQVRFEIGQVLREAGFQVSTLDSGYRAIDAVARGGVDLVIVDCNARGVNGLKVVQRLGEVAPGLSIMVLSRAKDPNLAITAFRLGAVDFFSKPADADQVLASVSRWRRNRMASTDHRSEKVALLASLKDSCEPLLRRLKNSRLNPDQKNCLEFVELNINQNISPYVIA